MNEAQRLWDECAGILRAQVSEPVWLTSFDAARAVDYDGTTLTLAVPSFLAKERIEGRYLSLVRDALEEVGAGHVELSLEIAAAEPEPAWTVAPPSAAPAGDEPAGEGPGPGTTPSTEEINPRYSFETFVIGPSNRFAHAAALAVAETPARKYNPLFVYGDAGLGKTHLLQAIGHYVRENYPTYRVRYVTSETFLNEFIDAVRTRTNDAFKRRYRDVDVLLVDDIQFIEGKTETQEEFFHTFNHLHQSNRQIVLSSDRPPDAIGTLEERLKSRFKMGLMVDVQPPDLETRLAILRNKAEREATSIPPEVLEYIATNITDNIRVLEGALIRVAAFANLTAEQLTVDKAAEILSDLLTTRQPRPITPQVILEATSKMFGIPVEEIIGKKRQRPLVTARQVAMYVFRELTDLSYPAIAREFGGRDHTTVIHAVDKIGTQMQHQRSVYDQVTELVQAIRAGA
ncbi:MAG TPA: chromosomal replication initiator protein DnaA [Acidimicrobiales bacterium]|nr:chromosomal replication initiator protein DnaA [Acidimicrobiales bacterium]